MGDRGRPAGKELRSGRRTQKEAAGGVRPASSASRDFETYRSFFENAVEGFFRSTPEGRFLDVNPAFAAMLGYAGPEELLSSVTDIPTQYYADPRDRLRFIEIMERDGAIHDYQYKARRKDGTEIPVSVIARAVRGVDGRIAGYEGIVQDVTELRRAEDALRRSEEMFRKAFQTSPDAININRLHDGMYVSSNEGFTRAIGFTPEELVGRTSSDINVWVEAADRQRLTEGLLMHGEVRNLEAAFRRKNGEMRYGLMSASLIDIGGVPHILSVTRDITERKRAEEAVGESEKRFRDLAELLPQAVFEFDMAGRFTYVNRFALDLFGYSREEFEAGVDVLDVVVAAERGQAATNVDRVMKGGFESGGEYTALRKSGEEFPVIIHSTPIVRDRRVIGVRGIVIDMTERKRLESQLTQAQKLEAVGTLAGGMAHNFNNILMGIQGHVSMMLMTMNPDHPHFDRLKNIENQIQSGADLTRQLLGFARGGKYEMRSLNLNLIVGRTAEMFAMTRKEIVVGMNLDRAPLTVLADRSQMEQMLMNLLVNAWQAMPAGGEVYLETDRVFLTSSELKPYEVAPGLYAKITVQDTGVGMDEKTRQRIFEPFFTTKQMGRGTGLGLATVYGIVKGHRGYITVSSEPGQGTRFDIFLPLSGGTAEAHDRTIAGVLRDEPPAGD